jgi:hypothetical protein
MPGSTTFGAAPNAGASGQISRIGTIGTAKPTRSLSAPTRPVIT